MVGRTKEIVYNNIYRPLLNKVKSPNRDAIWIFGLQKAGTSAIAKLLGHMSGSSVSIDPRCLWSPYGKKIRIGELSVKEHSNKFSYPFSRDIIKEPSTTFYIERIESYFYLHKYVFIVRNPYSNIRSILNRLDLPGDDIDINIADVHVNWRSKFKRGGKNYIQDLAELWLKANSQDQYQFNDRCVLVKYEDFKTNKEGFIKNLCIKLDFPLKNSIKGVMDKQFQPKGNDNVDLAEFFGDANLKTVDRICGRRMNELGYNENEIL